MNQRNFWIAFAFSLSLVITVHAQRNITVTGRVMQKVNKVVNGEKVEETVPAEYVFVYPLPDKATADAAMQQSVMYLHDRKSVFKDWLGPKYGLVEGQVATDVNGNYSVYDVPENGYLLYMPFSGEPKYQPINGKLELEDIVLDAEKGIVITEVNVNAKGKGLKVGDLVFGPYVLVKSTIPVDTMLQKKNVRLLIQPYVVDCDSTLKDTTFLSPRAFYGDENELTQERRLDFNLKIDSIISAQVDSMRQVYDGRYDFDGLVFKKKDTKRAYRAYAEVFYEDYNRVLHSEKFVIEHCEENKTMRFLDFKFGAMFLNPADPAFRVEPKLDNHDAVGDINLTFLNGKAILDPNNPNNDLEIARLQDEMLSIENSTNNYLRSVKIIGKASPEGNYESNKNLAGRRAAFAKNEIVSKLSQYTRNRMTIESDAVVAEWSEVADSLAKDSLFEMADRIREIVAQHEGNMARQFSEISRMSDYRSVIKEIYLPKLRAVKYEYTYQTKRALTDSEILENFRLSKDTVNHPNVFFDRYDYWRLANIVKDSADLRKIYKGYYEFTKKTQNGKADELAACNYAAFLIREGKADSTMLLPYIRKDASYANYQRQDMNTGKMITYNRIPVIANQLAMYVLCEDYASARYMNAYLPPSEEQRLLNAFLMCLYGKFDDPNYSEPVAATSPNNDIVISIANGGTQNLRHARLIAETKLKDDNPRKFYFMAQIDMKEGKTGKGSDAVAHLLDCFKVDEKFIEIANVDAVFVDNKGNKIEFDEAVEKFDKWKEDEEKKKNE